VSRPALGRTHPAANGYWRFFLVEICNNI